MSTRAHTVPKFYLSEFISPESKAGGDPYVYIGFIETGEIKKRSPKNISISRGLYDGSGGLENSEASIETHLSKIEWAAASAIRKLAASPCSEGAIVGTEIWRFLAWQAARTPGWMNLIEGWVAEWDPGAPIVAVQPPPDGFDSISDRHRSLLVENPQNRERREVVQPEEFHSLLGKGWKWILRNNDHLELLHIQAWYFQARHFPSFSWVRLDAPSGESFVTSDRAIAWIADGLANTPPASLRHPTAQILAPLTRGVALLGRHCSDGLDVTPRDVNRLVASMASGWIVGATADVVRQALADRPG